MLAALLAHQWPATFDDLARAVPAYGDEARALDARLRMFERDKDELRAFGVPIETVPGEEQPGYRLRKADFYLPYLAVADAVGGSGAARGRTTSAAPQRIDRWGYQSLRVLAFEPEELGAIAAAATRARALGDPALAEHAGHAVRKLAFDLPLDTGAGEDVALLPPRAASDPAVLDALGQALLARKTVTFQYRAMERDETTTRTVEPWGLFFLGGHWYLAARDPARGDGTAGLRNFRVSRISEVSSHGKRPQSPDFEVPASFRLRDHARARQPWELGDGEEEVAVVEFRAETGATLPALRLGEPVDGAGIARRRFRVRRREAFVRWLLTFAGEARPVAPPALVDAYREQLQRTWRVHGGASSRGAGVTGDAP
ncbi:helix-turn-helix transcriptional regulator [Roseisolibacter agri]|uniref:helix-turn-helix transcriptional regulator n=1 Tax=Roseisolibacter agri TaxID=2014610 RepID=UPI0024E174DD|nr:WYL domain-containing protein [Roseisolibacter agri]